LVRLRLLVRFYQAHLADPRRCSRELGPRPDGLGVWAQDGTDIAFLLEYDTGTEHLPQLVGKLTGYAEQAGTNTALTMPLLSCFPTARREQSARKALAATAASLDLQIATAALDPRVTCPACGPAPSPPAHRPAIPQHPAPLERNVTGWAAGTASTQ
jgi:hypothetical protein